MNHLNFRTVLLVLFVMAAALASLSCINEVGVGVGVAHPTSWGGGTGPPIFVGGPSSR